MRKYLPALVALVVVAVAMAAVLSPQKPPAERKRVNLLGSGATFPYPQIAAWIDDFSRKYPNVTINYNPTGSGTGQEQFFSQVVDFAVSDPPISREKWESWRGRFVQMPFVLGAVVVTYNLPEVSGRLRLDAETLALIYMGEIQYWNDERLRRLNPDLSLPERRIIAVHRSDSSGTTDVFTRFLHKAAPEAWPEELVGKSVEWPVDRRGNGVGGKGNQGVAEVLRTTPGSIGYLELNYVLELNMPTALIRNRDGRFVEANETTIMRAVVAASPSLPKSPDGDFSGDLDALLFAPGESSYPITSFSHLLFYISYSDPAKAWAVREFIRYVNTEGQGKVLRGYVPIPEEVRQLNLKALELIKGG
ncbi:MAG: phosphate ABC transporter substrate-binding protein PstS [Candidatus Korarchaeota archaeon NZ13-K]|nr:MAG: phosphate ABC transporter substrate-binding protein PstS [Candidatus Korarchaeota archaeon NZ13-K]